MDGLYNSPEKHTLAVMTRPGCPQVEGESPWILNINLEISEVWEKVWVSFLQKTDDSALSWVRALEGIAGVCVLVFTLVYACKSGPTVNRITSPHLPVLRWASGASYLSGNPHRSVIKTGNHLKPPGNYSFSRIIFFGCSVLTHGVCWSQIHSTTPAITPLTSLCIADWTRLWKGMWVENRFSCSGMWCRELAGWNINPRIVFFIKFH